MKTPGSYTLSRCLMKSIAEPTKESLDLSALIPAFEIEESIDSDTIYGSAMVIDTAGVLENYPIRGEEQLTIVVQDAMDTELTYNMFLYKVDNVAVAPNNQGVSYMIYFMSMQRWEASKKEVIIAYDDPPSSIVMDLYGRNYLSQQTSINKDIVVETMDEPIRITIPNYSAPKAMRFVCDRSYSKISRSCSFRFFETANEYIFASDEYLIKKAMDEGRVFDFTNAQLERSMETIPMQFNNLTEVTATRKINSVNDLVNGSYRAKTHKIDLNYGTYEEVKYEYKDGHFFGDYEDRHSSAFRDKELPHGVAKTFYITQQYDDQSYGSVASNQFYPEILMNRMSYRQHLSSMTITASGAGRLDITCGDVVNLTVFDFSDPANTPQKGSQSGEYIVHTVTKIFDKENMTNRYTMFKRGWNDIKNIAGIAS